MRTLWIVPVAPTEMFPCSQEVQNLLVYIAPVVKTQIQHKCLFVYCISVHINHEPLQGFVTHVPHMYIGSFTAGKGFGPLPVEVFPLGIEQGPKLGRGKSMQVDRNLVSIPFKQK
ncbi:hypothetical protein SDC9_73553 [bioreactor metagenome]|uniref:Uncharacterized protein n=1 Tax=bioreactor metagenome TaxID=1076179 RepID=A0A644YGD0_9ZZZZ